MPAYFFSVAGKATLLWPGLPQNPGLDWAYQAFLGHVFLASPAKTLPSLASLGLARLGQACHAFDRAAPDARERHATSSSQWGSHSKGLYRF